MAEDGAPITPSAVEQILLEPDALVSLVARLTEPKPVADVCAVMAKGTYWPQQG